MKSTKLQPPGTREPAGRARDSVRAVPRSPDAGAHGVTRPTFIGSWRLKLGVSLVLGGCCLVLSAVAQSSAFTYQGRLDTDGTPAQGIYDLRFAIYDVASAGTLVAEPLTNSSTTVSNGWFIVTLDFGAGVFTGAERWLELGVRSNNVGAFHLLTPRQSISAAPYAIRATQAATVDQGVVSNPLFLGTTTGSPLELFVNNQRALRIEDNGDGSDGNALPDGAPNLIGGSPANAVSLGVVGATIAGGGATNQNGTASPNTIASDYGLIGGGLGNHIAVRATAAVIAGGFRNNIRSNAAYSAILGGMDNGISTNTVYGTVGGGWLNDLGVKADFAVIGGGWANYIADNARWGVIAGGQGNTIGPAAEYSTVSGGLNNVASGASYAVIPGGRNNAVNTNASFAFAAGFRAKANHPGAFVWADATASDFASTATNQFNVRAGGGARFETSGAGLTLDGVGVFAGNNGSSLTNLNATQITHGTLADARLNGNVALKNQNNAFTANQSVPSGSAAAAGLAFNSDLDTGLFSPAANTLGLTTGATERMRLTSGGLLGLGTNNPAARLHIASAGSTPQLHLGQNDSVNAFTRIRFSVGNTNLWDLAAGGTANVLNFFNTANGNVMTLSTNGHLRVNHALGIGTDSTTARLTVAGDSSQPQLLLQQTTTGASPRLRLINANRPYWDMFTDSGGDFIRWYSERTGFNAMTLFDDGTLITAGPVNPPSDRNVKRDFSAVDALAVLEKVAELPIQSWAYKNSPDTRHIGPVAQDFHAAFGFGVDDRHIATVDADGVALAAIQGLNQKLEKRLQAQETEIAELKRALEKIQQLVNNLPSTQHQP